MPLPSSHRSSGRHTPRRSIYRRIARALWFWGVPAVLLCIFAGRLVEWETEHWWFASLGQSATFGTLLVWKLAAFCLTAGGFAAMLGYNARLAWRTAAESSAPLGWGMNWDGAGSRRLIPLEDKLGLDRFRTPGTVIFVGTVSWLAGLTAANHFDLWLEAFHSQPTGSYDSLWGHDLAFFLFQLPALGAAAAFVFWALLLTVGFVSLIYIYEEAIELGGRETTIVPEATRHLGTLCALLVAWKAVEWRLDALDSQSSGGLAPGYFGYAAAHYRLPALNLGSWLAVPAGALVWWLARHGRPRAAGLVTLIFPIVIWLGAAVVPLWTQANIVANQKGTLESQYLRQHSLATLTSWRLDGIREQKPDQRTSETAEQQTLNSLPCWPPAAVRAELNTQLDNKEFALIAGRPHLEIRLINGQPRLVYVAALQTTEGKPDATQPGATGKGGGIAVVDAVKRTPDGAPLIYLPAQLRNATDAKVTSPLDPKTPVQAESPVVFGEWIGLTPEGLDPASRTRPVDESDQGPLLNSLDWIPADGSAPRAVPLDSWWRRALAAWRFQNPSLIRGDTNSLYWHRRALQRCEQLAPFLEWGQADPRLVQGEGQRMVWLLDGYALSRRYPNAATPPLVASPFGGNNYVRRAVVATVDARNGSTYLYAMNGSEPFTALYQRAFPQLILPLDAMPPILRRQIHRPEAEFTARAAVWAQFHNLRASDLESKQNTGWLPAFGENASRDGGFTYDVLAPDGTNSLMHVAAFKRDEANQDKEIELTALLMESEQPAKADALQSWRPTEAISVNNDQVVDRSFSFMYHGLSSSHMGLTTALPAGKGILIAKGESTSKVMKADGGGGKREVLVLNSEWNFVGPDGVISIDLDGGGRMGGTRKEYLWEQAQAALRRYESAREHRDYKALDAAWAELKKALKP